LVPRLVCPLVRITTMFVFMLMIRKRKAANVRIEIAESLRGSMAGDGIAMGKTVRTSGRLSSLSAFRVPTAARSLRSNASRPLSFFLCPSPHRVHIESPKGQLLLVEKTASILGPSVPVGGESKLGDTGGFGRVFDLRRLIR
jgi:hypothetical protein